MKAALKRGVETGVLVQVKASYKLSPEAKKTKPATKPKAAAKKTVSKAKTDGKKKVSLGTQQCESALMHTSYVANAVIE
jgi:hypothetical protein